MSSLTGHAELTSVILMWTAPVKPNGIITSYKVAYTLDGEMFEFENVTNMNTTFIIEPLLPNTTVFEISVSAYTIIGSGKPAKILSISTLVPAPSCKIFHIDFLFYTEYYMIIFMKRNGVVRNHTLPKYPKKNKLYIIK